jgi:hypothetical protein
MQNLASHRLDLGRHFFDWLTIIVGNPIGEVFQEPEILAQGNV